MRGAEFNNSRKNWLGNGDATKLAFLVNLRAGHESHFKPTQTWREGTNPRHVGKLPPGLRCLLHCAFDLITNTGHAQRQAGGYTLRTAR